MSATTFRFRQLDVPETPGGDTLEAALAEAAAIREAARAEGLAEGRAAGEAAARAEAEATLDQLRTACASLAGLRDEWVSALEGDAVRLALRLAEQIVAGTIETEPARIVDVAGLALRRLAERRVVTLVVNPAELDVLNAAVATLRGELGGIEQLSVQADRRVGRGGVLARTEDGEIDATVEAQLARAREIVTEELGGAPGGDAAGPDAGSAVVA
jgi:flagellar assembly protein FliH